MSAAANQPTYSKAQVAKYFQRLNLPPEQYHYDVSALQPAEALAYLKLLQKLHLVAVPFENLTLHYSSHRAVSVHPEELFKKIVQDDNGRGGYCMENNAIFGTLLHSLGFTIYPAGARVFDQGSWTAWSHMVNLVTIGDIKYHVDVGFGGDGPVVPMPLDKSATVQPQILPGSTRLEWRNIPGNMDPNQRLWVFQYRRNDESDWEIKYSYTELEFQPQDYAMMNYFTSTSQRTFFTRIIVGEKKILGDDGEIAGQLILKGDSMKWRMHGSKQKEIKFTSEAERLDALEKYFGIKFGQADRDGIHGLPSEIKGT